MLTQIQVIIEIVLSFFLLLGIIYSFYLSRILSNLKRDRASLLGLVEKLASSVKSAEDGVEKLRIAGEVSGRPLSRMIEQAKMMGTELDTMVDKADATADRLEALATRIPSREKQLEALIEKAEEIRLDLLKKAEGAGNGLGAPQGTADPQDGLTMADHPADGNPAGPAAGDADAPAADNILPKEAKIQASAPARRKRRQLEALEKTFLARSIG
ncbi:DUF6468 domain-containing protein [Nguyenibacter vanlangensis]|uniref:DUF6468 domain-containing protein n=1 Tax=Nguyenibacter vanlangensis TaxID=1216886 RepID=UPI001FEBB7E0|nr:DUF6468 domain-containing protein [Nguyenibacter vanlangensis]